MNSTAPYILISDSVQFDLVCNAGLFPENGILVTGDCQLLSMRTQLKWPIISLWDHYRPEQQQKNHDEARAASTALSETLWTDVTYLGCHLASHVAHDLFFTFQAWLNVEDAVRGFIQHYRPSHAWLFGSSEHALLGDPPDTGPDIFNAAATAALMQGEVEIHRDTSLVWSKKTTKKSEASPLVYDRPMPADCIPHLAIHDTLSRAEQAGLVHRIAATGRESEWGVVADVPPAFSLSYVNLCALLKLPFKKFERTTQEAYTSNIMEHTTQLQCAPRIKALANHPEFAFIWKSWSNCQYAFDRYAITRLLTQSYKPQVAIMGYDAFSAQRCMVEGFLNGGCTPLSIDHVGLASPASAERNRNAFAHVAVWGAHDSAQQRKYRSKNAAVLSVGSLRMDVDAMREIASHHERKSSASFQLLLYTGMPCRGSTMVGRAWPADNERSWLGFVKCLSRYPDWHATIKIHPRNDRKDYYERIFASDKVKVHVTEEANTRLLARADVAILMNTASTVLVEVILAEVPCVFLKDAILPETVLSADCAGVLVADTMSELEALLLRLREDMSFRSDILAAQKSFLDRNLVATGEAAGQRLLDALSSIKSVASSNDERAGDTAARWVLDLIAVIDYTLRGELSMNPRDSRNRIRLLTELTRKGRELTFGDLEVLDTERLGLYYLRLVVWHPWPMLKSGARPLLRKMLLRVYFTLPRSIRPSLSVLRSHLVQACLQDIERAQEHEDLKSEAEKRRSVMDSLYLLWLRVLPYLLAPGRILNFKMRSVLITKNR